MKFDGGWRGWRHGPSKLPNSMFCFLTRFMPYNMDNTKIHILYNLENVQVKMKLDEISYTLAFISSTLALGKRIPSPPPPSLWRRPWSDQ